MTDAAAPEADDRVDDLGRLLDALLRGYLDRAAVALAGVPAGPRGVRVMQVAAEGACSNQARIAGELGLDRTVMTYLVDDLEAAGLVTRQPDPADRRSRRVVITDGGQAVLERVRATLGDIERETLGALDPAEAAQLRTLLERAASGLPSGHFCTAAPEADPASS